jgi:hypothetical protein
VLGGSVQFAQFRIPIDEFHGHRSHYTGNIDVRQK